jgi:general secretion pathway protein D
MKTRIALVLFSSFLSICSTFAGSFSEQCPDIPTCAKAVGELLGQSYVYDADLKGLVKATPGLQLTRENAELLFTNALDMENYARVPLGAGVFRIMRQRDARDSAIPTVVGDKQHAPAFPDTWDLMTFSYKATNPESVEAIARMVRSFMPANARIASIEMSGMLVVTDTAPNLKKLYEMIRANDLKPTAEVRKKWAEEEKFYQQRKLVELNAGGGKREETPHPAPSPAK